MKTVPTLCATTTIVAVSAVGYAVGRTELPPALEIPTVTPKPSQPRDSPMTADVTSRRLSSSPFYSSPLSVSNGGSGRLSLDGFRRGTGSRRPTVGEGTTRYSLDQARDSPLAPEGELARLAPRMTLRSRPSWIKRLSALSSSQNSSPVSSPRAESPSISYSNGSPSVFSNTGSTAPINGHRVPPPLPPNKLVKRPASQRTSNSSPSISRLPTLRRPATSHQRSQTLHARSRPAELQFGKRSFSDDHYPTPLTEPKYCHYFTARVAGDLTETKKRRPSGSVKSIKRLFADERYLPSLVMARSVIASAVEVDDSLSQYEESIYFGSRPSSPFGAHQLSESPKNEPTPLPESLSSPAADEEPRPRRSFSISDLLSTGPSSWKPRANRNPAVKLLRKGSRRSVSAPMHYPTNLKDIRPPQESERPKKRRDITDPTIYKRDIYTSSSYSPQPTTGDSSFSARTPPLDQWQIPIKSDHTSRQFQGPRRASADQHSPNPLPPSPTSSHVVNTSSHQSAAPSEKASTFMSSDNEGRGMSSGDDDDTDFTTDTMYDSIRTRTTRSASGSRAPRIDAVFDELPQATSKSKFSALRDFQADSSFRNSLVDMKGQDSILEEDESMATPIRTTLHEKRNVAPSLPQQTVLKERNDVNIPSSPPEIPQSLNLGSLEWDTKDDDEESGWSFGDNESIDDFGHDSDAFEGMATPLTLKRTNPLLGTIPSSLSDPPRFLSPPSSEKTKDKRSSIFDWSEQQPSDKSPGNRTPPRPKTVHGKKDTDSRGSRAVGRRAPSGLHARSQSVPVVPDLAGKRSTVVTNKFGTWGVGSKGVTEDWNDDFDFADTPTNDHQPESDEKRTDSGIAMVVPQTIREQQHNVLANIGLLREWGCLIEELKELRMRGITLGIMDGRFTDMWKEVDAMIDLADQETDEPSAPPRLSPPSSPGLDMDAFEDDAAHNKRARRKSGRVTSANFSDNAPTVVPYVPKSRRKSVLPDNDIFTSPPAVEPEENVHSAQQVTQITTRPRKDSEATARSVIEALKKRRSTSETLLNLQPVPAAKKVPFDTATLRHIVPYVNSLMRKVKEAMREVEGLYHSPVHTPKSQEPSFSQIFKEPTLDSSPSSRKGRRSRVNNGPIVPDGTENNLSTQMKLMTITRKSKNEKELGQDGSS